MKKGIEFYQRGCLRLWCFQSSVLEVAKKYIIAESSFCGSGDTAFSQKKFDLPAVGKSRWIFVKEANSSQRLGKTSQFFFVIFKSRSAFFQLYEFFFQMCRSCSPSSLIGHSQSSRWFFSVVLLEDVIVEDWGGFTNSLPREGPGNRYCDQILTIGVEKMLERRWRFFFFRLGRCSSASYILGSAGFLIRMVSNK